VVAEVDGAVAVPEEVALEAEAAVAMLRQA
jgi:hypothetical protein